MYGYAGYFCFSACVFVELQVQKLENKIQSASKLEHIPSTILLDFIFSVGIHLLWFEAIFVFLHVLLQRFKLENSRIKFLIALKIVAHIFSTIL